MDRFRGVLPRTRLSAMFGFFVIISGCHPEIEGDEGTPESSPSVGFETRWEGIRLGDELWKVGRLEGSEYEVLGRIADVTFAGTDLALSDGHSNRIHLFGGSGGHKASFGGSGGGPGEFQMVHSLDLLPDGTLAALNRGGTIEFFDSDGESKGSVLVPGSSREMCAMDSTLVVLGVLGGTDRPIHLLELATGAWTSIGATNAPDTENPHRDLLVSGLMRGSIACLDDRLLYARSSDGIVMAFNRDGAVLWEVEIPSFVPKVHEFAGERGVYHGPPEGATFIHEFSGVIPFGQTIAVQIWGLNLPKDEVSLSTVFLDLTSGNILGEDNSLPVIRAASGDRVAVERDEPWPEIAVFSVTHR